jgi:hypothetical protein
LARWCDRLERDGAHDRVQIVFVPISIRFGFNAESTVLRAVATRLAAIHNEPAFGDCVDDWRDLVSELMQRPPPEGTVLIVIDGLDEAAGWQADPSFFPSAPHPDIKLIVSARLTATHPRLDDWTRDLGWPNAVALELGPLTLEGVHDVLANMGPQLHTFAASPAAVQQLHEASMGDPLVVGLYADYLWSHAPTAMGPMTDLLGNATPGLSGFIDRWWEEQERLWDDPAAAANAHRVFDLLAGALGPLARRDLLDLARRARPTSGDELDVVLRALDRLIVSPSPNAYAVAHPRLVEHRLSRLREDGDLAALDGSFVEWAEESLDDTREPFSPYLVRHYGQHLERAQISPSRMTKLLEPQWRLAWLRLTDDDIGWIEDIDRVHAAASREDTAALTSHEYTRWAGLRAWCTCLRTDAEAIDVLVGGAFAAALVRQGRWSEQRALARCARVEDPWSRAEYLAALAPALSHDGALLAAQILRRLDADDEVAAHAMAAVVTRLVAEGDLSTVQSLAADVESPAVRAAGLVASFPALSEANRLEVLRDIDAQSADAHFDLLAPLIDRELAARAFGDPPWRYLEGLLRGGAPWWPTNRAAFEELDIPVKAYAFGSLAPWMTPTEREHYVEDCLESLEIYESPYNVGDAMAALAPHLTASTRRRARAIAAKLLRDHPQWLLLANISLLPCEPAAESATVLEQLAKSLPTLLEHVSPGEVSQALATLAARGASDPVLEALSMLEADDRNKAEYLAAVAPHLDLAAVHRALEIAAAVRQEDRPKAFAALLARQAECGEVDAALASASARDDTDEVRVGLAVLRVASGRESFHETLASLVEIENGQLRAAAAGVVARLSPPSAGDLLAIVSSFGPLIDIGDSLPMEVFSLVGTELHDEEWIAAETGQTEQAMSQWGLHRFKGQIMVDYFRRLATELGAQATLDRALEYCTETFDLPLAWAVVAVAHLLEPGMDIDRHRLIDAASENSDVVEAATVRLLPETHRHEARDDAIEAFGAAADLRPGACALLLGVVPDELYETAASALVPDALLDGESRLASLDTWARQMTELCPSLNAERLRRLQATSGKVSSGSARGELRAAIAIRFALLGEEGTALSISDSLDNEQAATVLARMADAVASAALPELIEAVRQHVHYEFFRGPGALVMAHLGRRIGELNSAELSSLLDRWHALAPHRDEVRADLLVYGPALLALGGQAAADSLADRLQDSRHSTGGGWGVGRDVTVRTPGG